MTKMTPHPRNDTERRILRVLDYIHDNPAGDLSLDALADVAAMSRFHWHRVFRAITGETAAQAVRRMRMHRASVALVESGEDVARIAKAVGYSNPASFARSFAELYGVSPLVFRAQNILHPEHYAKSRGGTLMSDYPVTIRKEPARQLAAMPHKGPYPEIGAAFEKLAGVIGARGMFPQVGRMVGVYYDDPSAVEAADLKSHAGFELRGGMELSDPLEGIDLPAGRHAVLTFKGPYTGLSAGYDHLYCNWLPASGETPADQPPFEVYLNSPMDTAPDDLVTEIMLPLG